MRELVRDVQVDGAAIRLRTLAPAGRSRDSLGPTLVLLHGVGGSRTMRALHRQLSRRHRTILVEWSGEGSAPAADLGGARYTASRIATALHEVGASDCLPIGHGRGAQIAVEIAQTDQELVRAVGCIAPVTDDRRRGVARQAADFLRDLMREPFVLSLLVLGGILRHPQHVLAVMPRALRYPMFRRVAELKVPVLLLRGHGDVLCGHDWARRLIGVATSGALIELPGLHHVHAQSARAVAALVDEFLRVDAIERLR
jgi:pimeloyl-ACP methyl ester carboxylesterase